MAANPQAFAPALHQTIVCVNFADNGHLRLSDSARLSACDALYDVMNGTLNMSGMLAGHVRWEGGSDGMMMVVSPEVPTHLVAMIPELVTAALRERNWKHRPEARIWLRMSIHAGATRLGCHGVTGEPVELAFNLLHSASVVGSLTDQALELVLVVSESFYQEVIRHDPARNPAAYISGKTISFGVETPTRTRVFVDPHPADQPVCTRALQYIADLFEKRKVQRDAHDFDEFYLGNFRFVRNVVNARAQDWTLAEEVTDEAMAIASRKWDELREHPNPVGFTVVTARRILSRTQRQQASKNPPAQPLSLEATPGLELKAADGDTASTAVNRIALEEALRVLTADQRECFVLHEILDHPVREVAGLLNLPESTVKTRLRAARQSLRHLLNDDSGEEGAK